MDLEMLIKMITQEVLKKVGNKINYNNKSVLVIFTGSTIELEESIVELKKLKDSLIDHQIKYLEVYFFLVKLTTVQVSRYRTI